MSRKLRRRFFGSAGRPRLRDRHRQNILNAVRCHPMNVSGFTIASASRQSKNFASATIARRNEAVVRRGFVSRSWNKASCFRRNRFSAKQSDTRGKDQPETPYCTGTCARSSRSDRIFADHRPAHSPLRSVSAKAGQQANEIARVRTATGATASFARCAAGLKIGFSTGTSSQSLMLLPHRRRIQSLPSRRPKRRNITDQIPSRCRW